MLFTMVLLRAYPTWFVRLRTLVSTLGGVQTLHFSIEFHNKASIAKLIDGFTFACTADGVSTGDCATWQVCDVSLVSPVSLSNIYIYIQICIYIYIYD